MLVVDASVALKWLVNEPDSGAARRFLPMRQNDVISTEHVLIAPELLLLESHNVLAGRVSRNEVPIDVLYESADVLRVACTIEPVDAALVRIARDLSIAPTGRPGAKPFNIYDCIYIAQALRYGATLLTADMLQARIADTVGIGVISP